MEWKKMKGRYSSKPVLIVFDTGLGLEAGYGMYSRADRSWVVAEKIQKKHDGELDPFFDSVWVKNKDVKYWAPMPDLPKDIDY